MQLFPDVKKKRAEFSALNVIWNVLHDIPNFAIQYLAKYFNRMSANTLITLQSGNLTGADIVMLNQRILCDAFFFHDIPKVIIRNQRYQPPFLLDIITEYSVQSY